MARVSKYGVTELMSIKESKQPNIDIISSNNYGNKKQKGNFTLPLKNQEYKYLI